MGQKDLEKARSIARENLKHLDRYNGENAYDHADRVTRILKEELEVEDYKVLVSAYLHDIIEDTPMEYEDIETLFNREVADIVKALTYKKKRFYKSNAEKSLYRIQEFQKLHNSPYEARIIKCADKIDNLRSARKIPKYHKKYPRIPYWIVEAKRAILPLAAETSSVAYKTLLNIIRSLEPDYPVPTRTY